MNELTRRAALALGLAISTGKVAAARAEILRPADPGGAPFPPTYFGMHMHHPERIAWPSAGFGTWRLWDSGVSWAEIEPSRGGILNFARLDSLLDIAGQHGVEVVLPLALTPAWASLRPDEKSAYRPGFAAPPRDMSDWAFFVSRLVQHTRGRVRAYELWNEANIALFFSGPPATLVEMARVLHEAVIRYDSGALVLAPSGAGLLDPRRNFVQDFVSAGGDSWVDALNFHLYTGPHPPEVLLGPVRELLAVAVRSGKPLWNTESGYWVRPGPGQRGSLHNDAHPDLIAAAYLVRAHVIARALGVARYIAYAWDNGDLPFVADDGRTLNAVGSAYTSMIRLLTNARLQECTVDRNGPCHALLSDRAGLPFALAWSCGGDVAGWRPPSAGGPLQVTTLEGQLLADAAQNVDLGDMPKLLRWKARGS